MVPKAAVVGFCERDDSRAPGNPAIARFRGLLERHEEGRSVCGAKLWFFGQAGVNQCRQRRRQVFLLVHGLGEGLHFTPNVSPKDVRSCPSERRATR